MYRPPGSLQSMTGTPYRSPVLMSPQSAAISPQSRIPSLPFSRIVPARQSSRSVESTTHSLASLGSTGMQSMHNRVGSMDSAGGSPAASMGRYQSARRYSHDGAGPSMEHLSTGSQSPTSFSRQTSRRWSQRYLSNGDENGEMLMRKPSKRYQPHSTPASGESSPTSTFARHPSTRRYGPHMEQSNPDGSPASFIRQGSRRYAPKATYVPPNPYLAQGKPMNQSRSGILHSYGSKCVV